MILTDIAAQLAPCGMSASPPDDADLEAEIRDLKSKRNAVILAHYYQPDEIQDIADFVGDSLALSQYAARTSAETIAFCGVHFMAETAALLNPRRRVVVPDLDAGCSLADRCDAGAFSRWLAGYRGHTVVTYINSSAAVKALSDVICTSSNAVDIVRCLPPERPIVFAPDRHLGRWVMRATGRDLVLWPGFCIVHEQFSHRRLVQLRARHPGAKVVAHPECDQAVLDLADFVGSTQALLRYVTLSVHKAFIVATEVGILHPMRRARPDATFIPAPPHSGCDCALCPYMRLNTLEKLRDCLRDGRPAIDLDPATATRARHAVERMLALTTS
jgi:quinolinate synthase